MVCGELLELSPEELCCAAEEAEAGTAGKAKSSASSSPERCCLRLPCVTAVAPEEVSAAVEGERGVAIASARGRWRLAWQKLVLFSVV